MSKECSNCGVVKPLEEFYRKLDGRCARCKDCTKDVREAALCPHGKRKDYCVDCGGKKRVCPCGEARQRTECRKCSPKSFLDGGAGKQIHLLERHYGMYPYEYYFIRCLQNNACPLCDDPLVSGDIHIDHLHGTDIVRGLLHSYCNINVLGRYEAIGRTDNPKFEEYKQRNPLRRNPSNDPPLVYEHGS